MELKKIIRPLMDNCLHWNLQVPEGESLSELIQEIGEYNKFDPQDVIEALNEIKGLLGDRHFTITIGREYSPVIYVEYRKNEKDIVNAHFRAEESDVVGKIMNIFEIAKADEIDNESKEDSSWCKIRAWWD